MFKSVVLVVLGLLAGVGLIQIIPDQGPVSDQVTESTSPASAADPDVLPARVVALEAQLIAEIGARQALAEELALVAEELQSLREGMIGRLDARGAADEPSTGFRRGFGRFADSEQRAEQRREALVAAGFPPDQAAQILRREGELRMDAMYRRYQALRGEDSGEPAVSRLGQGLASNPLRQELGDADYDRYLYATGQPNRVRVAEVIETSPAAQAGLAPGDTVLSYGGERVFNFRELVSLTSVGEPGDMVAMEVLRDGSRTQLYLPRGPIGMVGGRRARVDPNDNP